MAVTGSSGESSGESSGARRQRVRKFDRPPPPHDWRWWVGGVGKVLIAAGLLMFGFVAYQLWGTGIETARAQNSLEGEFEELLAVSPQTPTTVAPAPTVPVDSTVPDTTVPVEPAAAVAPPVPPDLQDGDAIARLELPRIGVDKIVVAGVDKNDLKRGPGHYPETPLPGQLGNAAIAGHRTTFGQPFFDVDKMENGDEIIVTTLAGRFVYRVTGQEIVTPSDYQVIATTDPTKATLVLTSCHPKYTARERIIIYAELDQLATDGVVSEATLNYGRPLDDIPITDDPDPTNTVLDPATAGADGDDELATDATQSDEATATDTTAPATDELSQVEQAQLNDGIADAFSDGWFSDPGANSQVALWGSLLALIGALSYLLSRQTRRDWVGLLVGITPFVVTLYFFFQNVNRLLPPNL